MLVLQVATLIIVNLDKNSPNGGVAYQEILDPPLVSSELCALCAITLSVTQNSQDHGASFCLVQDRPGLQLSMCVYS